MKEELVPQKTQERWRLKIPERLRQELLQVSPRASSKKGAHVPIKTAERQGSKFQSHWGRNCSSRSLKPLVHRVNLCLPSPHRKHLYLTGTLYIPVSHREQECCFLLRKQQCQPEPMPSRISKVAPVFSGTLEGAFVTRSSPQQGANPRITEMQKRREQWRQQQR